MTGPFPPILAALGATALSLVLLAGFTLLRWRFARKHWAAHPGGPRGYLRDLAVSVAVVLPLLAAALVLRVITLNDPAAASQTTLLAVLIVGYAVMILARRLPPFSTASARLRDARLAPLDSQA